MTTELIQGLLRGEEKRMQGGLAGLKGAAAGITLDMRDSPAHGDQTGASHANYSARAVGPGEDGSSQLATARAAATALNPSEVGSTSSVVIDGELGMIFDSQLEYSPDLETENAGEKAVIGPTVTSAGPRCTAAVASGMKRAMGG